MHIVAPPSQASAQRSVTAAHAPCRLVGRSVRLTLTRAYDVEVEPDRPSAPNSAPRFGGGPPPPPPPPPPVQPARGLQPPSRRELLFGAVGLALGVGGTTAFNNRPIPQEELEERMTELLDGLLDDEAILDLLGEEVFLNQQLKDAEANMTALEGLQQIDSDLQDLVNGAQK